MVRCTKLNFDDEEAFDRGGCVGACDGIAYLRDGTQRFAKLISMMRKLLIGVVLLVLAAAVGRKFELQM